MFVVVAGGAMRFNSVQSGIPEVFAISGGVRCISPTVHSDSHFMLDPCDLCAKTTGPRRFL